MTGKFQTRTHLTDSELGNLNGSWVTSGSAQTRSGGYLQTQLLFNRAVPASASNRATHVGPPAPIVIEKLLSPSVAVQNGNDSVSSSVCFSVLSEQRLQDAVRLAKRDMRRRRRESACSSSSQQHPDEITQDRKSVNPQKPKRDASKLQQRAVGSKEVTRSGTTVLVYKPQELPLPPRTEHVLSPPTRDSAPEPQLSQEICRLQKELGTYIQRIEELANRGRTAGELDPEEERRVEVRRQEQAARSARILYVLQQQVKEIQEDLDKLRSQKIRHTKKSRAMDRLAAAHRGAVRAIQVFVSQLPDQSERKMPSHYRELGQLIRQLSLCSAKVEEVQGSSVPETANDILQKLEALDSALSKQESARAEQRAQSSSPARRRSPGGRQSSASPPRERRAVTARGPRGARKPPAARRNLQDRRLVVPRPRTADPHTLDRSEVLREGLKKLIRMRELGEGSPTNHRRVPLPEKSKVAPQLDSRFWQPTVSSQLKKIQLLQRGAAIPWIPTSPHASPLQIGPPKRPEPRCLFSAQKEPAGPVEQQAPARKAAEQGLGPEKRTEAHREAIRRAWLDREEMRRLKELNQLSQEEAERISRLRLEGTSPTEWAERAERAARERLQPLLDQAQRIRESWDRKGTSLRHRLSEQAADKAAASADLLSEAILDDLLEDTVLAMWEMERSREGDRLAQQRLEAPTLESMLLRMEEIERDEEAVRRRFADISYSDPRFWPKEDGTAPRMSPDCRPASPRPIRLTRPALRKDPTADIVLESPVEAGAASETSLVDDITSGTRPPEPAQPITAERGKGALLSVPVSMQKSVQKYREEHDSYLRLVSHEAVGSFNPWAIADSLADELMNEALVDVAAEFQDMCEEYAEAVFTSEFLQPDQSPAESHTQQDSQ
ncbi:hypothetical protein MATL_G00116310 [Megalops atlanticus]|uniref:Protein moonraker n=1 Tax=Megalops atlanticus TaxID=7932 RepID=A0A9D3PWV8_MEGAT|nr:hypothetical protein MATL_G00116310 [Megalops atlanticus]